MTAKKERKQQRRARRRKAQRTQQPSGQQVLLKRAQKSNYLKDAEILVNPAGSEKMSDVITRFAEPLKGPDGVLTAKMIQFAASIMESATSPLLCEAKAPQYRRHRAFEDADDHPEWPKVADTVIEAQFAILVWNASLLPESEQIQALKDTANIVTESDRETHR